MSGSRIPGDERVLEASRALVDCGNRRNFVGEARRFLERAIGADASMWFPGDRNEQHFTGAVWPSIATDVQRAYAGGLFRDDPIYCWIQEDPTAPNVSVTTLRDLSARGCVLTAAWRERCYQPCSIADILCVVHVRNGLIVGNFSLHRADSARPFGAREVRSARLLAHLLGAIYNALPEVSISDRVAGASRWGLRGLAPREQMIAALASEGLGSKEIAKRAGSSRKTVDNQLSSIYAKLGVRGRAALAKRYWELRAQPPVS